MRHRLLRLSLSRLHVAWSPGVLAFFMHLAVGRPSQVVNWFHEIDRQHDVMCLCVAPKVADRERIAAFAEDFVALDVVLRKRVAFMLFDPSGKQQMTLARFPDDLPVPGILVDARLPRRPPRMIRDVVKGGGLAPWDEIARQSAMFVPELAELFELSAHDMPAICVLVKGIEEAAVVRVGDTWNADTVTSCLEQLVQIAESDREDKKAFAAAGVLSDKSEEFCMHVRGIGYSIERELDEIKLGFHELCERHECDVAVVQEIATLVANGRCAADQVEVLIARIVPDQTVRKRSNHVRRVMRSTEKLRWLQEAARELAQRELLDDNVVAAVERVKRRRERIRKEVEDLARNRHELRRVQRPSFRVSRETARGIADFVNVWGGAGNKVHDALLWVMKMLG